MKISISLPPADVELLDSYARANGLASRSAAVHRAVALLAHPDLEDDYAEAWAEWESAPDRVAWESASEDGTSDAAR